MKLKSLAQLLNCPNRPQTQLYSYLPVSTSLPQELKNVSQRLLSKGSLHGRRKPTEQIFKPNQQSPNIQNELILLKLKGYIDQKDFHGKSTQIRQLPKQVQVGRIIEGDFVQNAKILSKKKFSNIIDYYLKKDQETKFTKRKFSEIQSLKQRKRKLKRKIMKKKAK